MGVIIDSGIQAEIDQLEATGNLSLADEFRHANEISVAALSFMTTVPAQYQALVANTPAYQAAQKQRDEKAKEEEKQKENAALSAYQQQLDSNMLHLTIDGEDIQISQGDLRKAMKQRVEELEEQKKELLKNGGSPEQINKVDNLIGDYNSASDDSENKPLDPNQIKKLMSEDPDWAPELKHQHTLSAADNSVSGNMRTSFSNEAFGDGGIAARALTPTFANSASPAPVPPAVPSQTPTFEKQQQSLNNALQSAGF